MDTPAKISLLQLFACKEDWEKTVVLKGLPDDLDEERLVLFLGIFEQYTSMELKALCQAYPSAPAIIAVFDQHIGETEKYDAVLEKRKLKGKKIIIENLRDAVGVFLPSFPLAVDLDFITLYFESKKKCGADCGDVSVRFSSLGSSAAVTITDKTAISTILDQGSHMMRNMPVAVEPYFPVYHDYIMDHITDDKKEPEEEPINQPDPVVTEKKKKRDIFEEKTLNVFVKSKPDKSQELDKSNVTRKSVDHETLHCHVPKIDIPDSITNTGSSGKQAVFSRESSVKMENEVIQPFKQESPLWDTEHSTKQSVMHCTLDFEPTETQDSKYTFPQLSPSQHNLSTDSNQSANISRSDPESISSVESNNTYSRASVTRNTPAKLFDCIIEGSENVIPPAANEVHSTQQIPLVSPETKPQIEPEPHIEPMQWREQYSEKDELTAENKNRNRKPAGARARNRPAEQRNTRRQKDMMNEHVAVEATKLHLLEMNNYSSNSPENVDIRFCIDETQSKVMIYGPSKQVITAEKLKLYEHLHQICEKTDSLPQEQIDLLHRNGSMDHIRYLCKKKDLKVFVSVSDKNFKCVAFSEQEAEQGLKLVKDSIQMRHVKLRPGQKDLFVGEKWSTFVASTKGTLAVLHLSVDKSRVIIESLKGKVAEQMRKKVVEYLKENVVRVTTKFELNGAKAKCFEKCLKQSLEKTISERKGTMDVKVVKRDCPMKLSLTVEGEESVVKATNECLDQIWHERFDFEKVSVNDQDQWLLMKGLNGEHGKPFFKSFEQDHNCFIDVTKAGQIQPPAMDRKEEKVHRPVSIPSEKSSGYNSSPDEPVTFVLYQRKASVEFDRSSYQHSNMDDDTAFQQAIQNSLMGASSIGTVEEDTHNFQPSVMWQGDPFDDTPIRSSKQIVDDWQPTFPVFPSRRRDQMRTAQSMPTFGCDSDSCDEDIEQPRCSVMINNTEVVLQKGNIAKFKADCLVSIIGSKGSLEEGAVSNALLNEGGPELNRMFKQTYAPNGRVIVTRACGKLQCQQVFHVTLEKHSDDCSQVVQNVMAEVLQQCVRQGYSSVAIPPLGVGRMYKYPSSAVVRAMLQAIQTSRCRNIAITFIVYDDKTFSQCRQEFKTWETSNTGLRFAGIPQRAIPTISGLQKPHRNFAQLQTRPNQIPTISNIPKHPRDGLPLRKIPTQHRRSMEDVRSASPTHRYHRSAGQRTNSNKPEFKTKVPYEEVKPSKPPRRKSRFPSDSPTEKLTVVVYAESKDKCIQARDNLCNKIKAKFLFEEKVKKVPVLSDEAKEKIVRIISKHNVKSVKVREGYVLRGHEESTKTAAMEIMNFLLEVGGRSESSVRERKQRKLQTKRGTTEYIEIMAKEDEEVPEYWKHFKPGQPIKNVITDVKQFFKGKKHIKVPINNSDPEFNAILGLINSTWDPTTRGQGKDALGLDRIQYSKLHVIKIERIENIDLFDGYAKKRNVCFRGLLKHNKTRYPKLETLPGCTGKIKTVKLYKHTPLKKDMHSEINEFYLFHGTKSDNVDVICEQGLDNRLASGSAMFGQGIYGAETASKADQYTDDKGARSAGQGNPKKMFLIRMLLGNAFLCTNHNPEKYKIPPCSTCYTHICKKHPDKFDSVVGDNGKLFREFVVYSKEESYPEYLITYERR